MYFLHNEYEYKEKDIILTYKNTGKFVKILGDEFVKKNINNLKIVFKNEQEHLKEKVFPLNMENIFEIGLKVINRLKDLSYMFYDCSSLIEVNKFDINFSEITNIE